ncbi:MAG: copper chaperone [Saprospirales bacterium]|nr:MAG: copper chaperone [Saprospirales bacterium]
MKTIIILAVNFFLAFSAIGQYDQFTVRVDGLGCAFCAAGVESQFKQVEGIKNIEIDLRNGILTYKVPSSMEMTFERVVTLIDEAGYTAVSVDVVRADGTEESFKNKDAEIELAEEEIMEATFKVLGNCGMCKDRIEKAAMAVKGVSKANWSEEDQELYIEFDSSTANIDDIHKAVARVGHDTELVKAPNRVYNRLHHCCKYDREK